MTLTCLSGEDCLERLYLNSFLLELAAAATIAADTDAAVDVGEKRVGETSRHTGRHGRRAGRQAPNLYYE